MTADTAQRTSASWRGRAAAGALVLCAVVAFGMVSRAGGPSPESASGQRAASSPGFPALPGLQLPVGTTLVCGDQNGVTLTTREQGRTDSVSILHLPAGPKQLVRVGPSSAVLLASDETAFLIDGRYSPPRVRDLGPGDWALPSATPGHLWLFRQEKSRWHAAERTFEGDTIRTLDHRYESRPIGVTPDGLVSRNGYGTVVDRRGGALDGAALAVHGERIAFCPYPCRLLHVRERPGSVSEPFAAPPGMVFGGPTAFSPDGRYVATALRTMAVSRTQIGTAVVDTQTGTVHRLTDHRHRALGQAEWAPDGSLLFIPATQGRLLAWEPQTQRLHEVDLSFRLLPWHGFTVFQDTGEEPPPDIEMPPVEGLSGLLGVTTHTELLLLDLASGHVERTALPGQAAGDPPHRLVERAGRLVQWQGDGPVVTDPRRRPLRWAPVIDGEWFVPAAAPDRIWVAQGRMGKWPLPLVEVDLGGAVHRQAQLGTGRYPLLGVGELLLVQDAQSRLILWDPATGEDREVLGEGFAIEARGDTLAWCPYPCDTVVVRRDGADVRRFAAGDGAMFSAGRATLSPDGRLLALPVVSGDTAHVAVLDLDSGEQHPVIDTAEPLGMAWTADSRSLVMALDARRLAVWGQRDGAVHELPSQLPIPMEQWFGFVVAASSG